MDDCFDDYSDACASLLIHAVHRAVNLGLIKILIESTGGLRFLFFTDNSLLIYMGYGDLATLPQSPPSILDMRLAGLGRAPSAPVYVPVPSGPIYVPIPATVGEDARTQKDSQNGELRELRSRVNELEGQLKTEIEAQNQTEQPDYKIKRYHELLQYVKHMKERKRYGTDAFEAFSEMIECGPTFRKNDPWNDDEIDYAMKQVYGRFGNAWILDWKSDFYTARSWHMDRQREAQRMNDTEYRSATQDTRREDIAEKPSSEKSRLILPGQDGWF